MIFKNDHDYRLAVLHDRVHTALYVARETLRKVGSEYVRQMSEAMGALDVVRVEGLSLVSTGLSDEATVKYPVKSWAYPHEGNGPLAVFKAEECARAWVMTWNLRLRLEAWCGDYDLWTCTYKHDPDATGFYTARHLVTVKMDEWPYGTEAASAVMLDEPVAHIEILGTEKMIWRRALTKINFTFDYVGDDR